MFSNRCWSRHHAYDQSYDDLYHQQKTDRSIMEIVANIADRSHVRQIATNRTIKQSYDPVWLWFYQDKDEHVSIQRVLRVIVYLVAYETWRTMQEDWERTSDAGFWEYTSQSLIYII